jgi:hypothetical protein
MDKKDKATLMLIGGFVFIAVAAALTAILTMDTRGERGSGLSSEFFYDLDHLKQTDPALILYDEAVDPIPTGLVQPLGLAVGPDDAIYVAGERTVRVFSPDGEPGTLEIALEGDPRCLDVTNDGTVYVGVQDHVEIYSPEGRRVNRWESAGPNAMLTSIAVAGEVVYAAEFSSKEVLRYDRSGNPLESLGEFVFVVPSPYFDVALGADGMVHVANTGEHCIEAYAPDGDLMSFWGEFSNTDVRRFSGCCNPVNIALLPDGQGFVTAEKGLTRVKVYDAEGAFKGFVAGPESFTRHDSLCSSPDYDANRSGLDVAVDGRGRILVLDPATAEIRIFVSRAR